MSSMQPVTKTLLTLTIGITLLPVLNVVPIYSLIFVNIKPYVFTQWWGVVTSFFLITNTSNPLPVLMRIYALYSHSNELETAHFMRPQQFIYYLLFNSIMVLLFTFYFPWNLSWCFEPCLQMFLSYTWSNVNYNKQIRFYGIIPLPAKYSCLMEIILNLVFSSGDFVASSGILGLASAYVYHCLATHSFGPIYGFFNYKLLGRTEKPYIIVKSKTLNGKFKEMQMPNPDFKQGSNNNYGYGGGAPLYPQWFNKMSNLVWNSLVSTKEKPLVNTSKKAGHGRRLGSLPAQSSTSARSNAAASASARFKGEGRRLGDE
ncbi:hypothetical protein ACO0RG_003990 [Hanseniaspora osmophila]|uniref:Derlin n=1 Tax=Hanseniaspora osmophila TaxID=56408 RepID=A0A1E5RAF5_9ASCO|nr:DER1-like family member protein 1 [Hanseniaspora osmophila]